MSEHVWREQSTTPSAIEAALRELLKERHAENEAYVPARVLNLVVIVDRDWKGEVANRLDRVGRYHASRTILCSVSKSQKTIDALVSLGSDEETSEMKPGELMTGREGVVIDVGPAHLPHLETIVDPLVVTDLPTVVWSPHGHDQAVDALLKLSQIVLYDSVEAPSAEEAFARADMLAEQARVVDLAWLRSTPWRERIAASFDPEPMREELRRISAVTARHRPDSASAGLLLLGWLASRLGWEPGKMIAQDGKLHGHARGGRQDVDLCLESDDHQSAPGLSGITIETASGTSLSLDRGAGGLSARRIERDGSESSWTVLGASRGEAGILGEGIRQAMLRDHTYGPALEAARAML